MNESHKRHRRRKAVGLHSFAVKIHRKTGRPWASLGHRPGGRLAREGLGGEESALYRDSAVLLKHIHTSVKTVKLNVCLSMPLKFT